ncbi:flavin reductase family protein [Mycobacterium talmoniae]|uniref:Flavin reductase n=1 Tax=Mycobacterium talmoniae TaxID=1858794 RepID=A0A1S1NPJ6_9MYCO|nr:MULTISPECIES: flavin reductase family protein [Mycobacterium]OHV06207.1 flavin reductase [Mycobacterium talmoniae]PQM48717.1 Flavin-dependent monooxygenase, reductase subunit HsaB [Mycobacterium talmoniae]TDH57094.1 flavin reductase [Mycobacterium eburneum]
MIAIESLGADPGLLRRAFGCFPSGVTAVAALVDDKPVGMAASSFTSVSLAPPLVSVCFQATSGTWRSLRDLPRLGISVLAQGQDEICMSLARQSADRFAGVAWDRTPEGAVFVRGATAWLECSVHGEVSAGDHAVALLEIHGLRANPDAAPLVFHGSRFRRLAAIAFGGDVADFVNPE